MSERVIMTRVLRNHEKDDGSFDLHPEVERMTGILAAETGTDSSETYHEHVLAKNR